MKCVRASTSAGTSCMKPCCKEGLAKVCKVHAVELKMAFNLYMIDHTHIFTLDPSSENF